MRSKNLSVVREASRGVGNLLNTRGAHPIFIDENGLLSLFLVARGSDNECQFNAAVIYRKLSPNLGTHASIHNYPDPRGMCKVGLHPLIGLAQLRDPRIAAMSAAALFYFSSNQEFKARRHSSDSRAWPPVWHCPHSPLCAAHCDKTNLQVAFADAGGLRAMISIAREETRELRMLGCGALRHLSISTRLKKPIVDEGGLGPLFEVSPQAVRALVGFDPPPHTHTA